MLLLQGRIDVLGERRIYLEGDPDFFVPILIVPRIFITGLVEPQIIIIQKPSRHEIYVAPVLDFIRCVHQKMAAEMYPPRCSDHCVRRKAYRANTMILEQVIAQ